MVIVLTGPSGSGKSTVGAVLASRTGWTFVDADDRHSPARGERTTDGTARHDSPAAEWVDALHRRIEAAAGRRVPLILACPALSRDHRTRLVGGLRGVRVVYLKAPADVLRARLATRPWQIAGTAPPDRQIANLEEPAPDETVLTLDATADPDTIVGHIRLEFGV